MLLVHFLLPPSTQPRLLAHPRLRCLTGAAAAPAADAGPRGGAPPVDLGQILVKFHEPSTPAAAATLARQVAALPGVRLAGRIAAVPDPGAPAAAAAAATGAGDGFNGRDVFVFRVTDGSSAAVKAAAVQRLPGVRLAEPDELVPVAAQPTDSYYAIGVQKVGKRARR